MDLGKAIEDAWRLFVKDVAALIVGVLLALILSVVSLGILAGPLMGGVFMMVSRRVREGRPAQIGDIFGKFDRFGSLFGAFWVLGIITFIGYLFFIIPGLLLSAIWFYVFLFIVDRDMSMGEAMTASRELVMRNGLWLHVAVVLLIAIVSAIVGHITGIGFLLTYPLTITLVTAMYFRGQGEDALVEQACTSHSYGMAYAPPAPPSGVGPQHVSGPVTTDPQSGQMQPHCSQCGASVPASSAFCAACGSVVSGGPQEPPVAPQLTPPSAPPAADAAWVTEPAPGAAEASEPAPGAAGMTEPAPDALAATEPATDGGQEPPAEPGAPQQFPGSVS